MVELIGVIVILAVLSGVAVTSLESLDDREVGFAANSTADHLSFLRQRAAATGRSTWATFSSGADTMEFREDDPAAPGFAGSVPLVDPVTGKASFIDLPSEYGGSIDVTDVSFGGESTIGFDWLGRPILPGGAVLTESGAVTLNDAFDVSVHGDSGLVTVEDH